MVNIFPKKSLPNIGILAALCLLIFPSWLRGGEQTQSWLAQAVIPEAIISPEIDGKAADVVWRSKSAKPRPFMLLHNPQPAAAAITARLACDHENLYILLHRTAWQVDKQTAATSRPAPTEYVSIDFGPAPWLRYRLTVDPAGRGQDLRWNGWELDANWQSQAQVVTTHNQQSWTAEIAIPRWTINPTALRAGARVALRFSLHRKDDSVAAILRLDQGWGVVLGQDFAPQSLTLKKIAAGRELLRLGFINWSVGGAPLKTALDYLAPANTKNKIGWRTLTQKKAGWTLFAFPENPPPGGIRRTWALQFIRRGEPRTICPLPLRGKYSPQNGELLRAALQQTAAGKNPSTATAKRILNLWNQQRVDTTFSTLAAALKNTPSSTISINPNAEESPPAAARKDPLVAKLLADTIDPDGTPHWSALAQLAKTKAYARQAYRRALTLADFRAGDYPLATATSDEGITEASRRFRLWTAFRKHLRRPTFVHPHPAWEPVIAAQRLQVLVDLATGPFTQPAATADLPDCLEEILATTAWLGDMFTRSGASETYDFIVYKALTSASERLPILYAGSGSRLLRSYWAGAQLAAWMQPDGAGLVPGTNEVAYLQACMRGIGLRASVLHDTAIDPRLAGEKILSYLSAQMLPTGRLPNLGIGMATEGWRVPTTTLAKWARIYYQDHPEFSRLLPEGLVARPLNKSLPPPHTATYGGIYAMRSPTDGLACFVIGAGGEGSDDRAASARYGAVLLADTQAEYLVEPASEKTGWFASLLLDNLPPAPSALPRVGYALPHLWRVSSEADYLTLNWQPSGIAAGGQATKSQGRRTVVLLKSSVGRSCVYIRDEFRATAGAHHFTQSFARLTQGTTPARIMPFSGQTFTRQKISADRERIDLRGDFSGTTTADLFVVPPADKKNPAVQIERLGKPRQTGGGVYRLINQTAEGVSQKIFVLSAPEDGKLTGEFGKTSATLHGEVAVLRLDAKGLAAITGFQITRVELTTEPTWSLRCSRPASVMIRRLSDGSFVGELLSKPDDPVTVEITLTPSGRGSESLSARINLEYGKRVTFRLV